MYIPKHYQGKQKDAIKFMKRFSFGTIITSIDNVPVATHLPFVISERDDQVIITSHLSKANPHWEHLESSENLIIFSEPHAYISPKNYEKKENVPTWNYLAVHAYGKAKIIKGLDNNVAVLESMIQQFEPEYHKQWSTLSDEYKQRMVKGIVAFEIQVSKLESKEKLSQNKKKPERESIIESLSRSSDSNEKMLAEYMKLKEE